MSQPLIAPYESPEFDVVHRTLTLQTTARVAFLDVTDQVAEVIRQTGITSGLVSVQTHHTTTAIVVNENEPLLHQDLLWLMERWAPRWAGYRHDQMERRGPEVLPDERPNGDSHARAMVLGASETIAIKGGHLQLGRWQRVFLVELDGERRRELSVSVLGLRG